MPNRKKSLKLRTNTNYFDPSVTRVINTFQSPHTYQSRRQKIEGYEARLYWQYRYCQDHNGVTFFYTLTYNDRHLPKFYDMNCFDYEDLRDLLTGGFRKQLLRKYGTTFKYFIGAELGDGKGERGMANNPHYHVLFFLEDAHNPRFPYKRIDPEDFRHLVRMYWQGFDEDEDKKNGVFHDYRKARYGIAREGENIGVVTDFRACMYVAKYVTKDVKLTRAEGKLRQYLAHDLFDKYNETEESYRAFFDEYISPNYEKYTVDSIAPWEDGFDESPYPIDEVGFKSVYHVMKPEAETLEDILHYIKEYDLGSEYTHFLRNWITPKVEEYIKLYRNRYCNKCRISQGVGHYAIEQPDYDPLSGTIPVPSKDGFKNRPINMYYYRQLFMDYHVDKSGSVRYILNERGVQYKLANLPKQIKRLAERAKNNLNLVLYNPDLYSRMLHSDVNTEVFTPYPEFLADMNYLFNENNNINIFERYAEYKLIYEDRFFAYHPDGTHSVTDFPVLDPYSDYRRFITSIGCYRNACNIMSFFENDCEGYISYQSHPAFLQYSSVFRVLDLCADYFFIQGDDKAQREAEEKAAIKRFHDREKLNDFYSRFAI